MFSVKDPIPIRPCAYLVVRFCVRAVKPTVVETTRHFSTHVGEHMVSDGIS